MKTTLKLLSIVFIVSGVLWSCQEDSESVQPSNTDTAIGSDTTVTVVNPDSLASSKIGIWLWALEFHDGFASHEELATRLASLGVNRVYVKVADGRYLPNNCSQTGEYVASCWPEIIDASVPKAYKDKGIECWAWSYNYPGNNEAQGEALYQAAKTGYDGFVVDIEIEFNGKSTEVHEIMQAFTNARTKAQEEGHAAADFKLYCTTWGNPIDHNFRVDIVDEYVDGHMPQTYLEVWGDTYMNNATHWVNVGTEEYHSLGCVKPIHHIVSAEHKKITSAQINEVIQASGAETSIWRIPGGGTPLSIWNDLEQVDWDAFEND